MRGFLKIMAQLVVVSGWLLFVYACVAYMKIWPIEEIDRLRIELIKTKAALTECKIDAGVKREKELW